MSFIEEELFHTQQNLYYSFNTHHFRIYVAFPRLTGTILAEVDRIGQGLSLKSFCVDFSMTFVI